jgi:FHA domain-containing protein
MFGLRGLEHDPLASFMADLAPARGAAPDATSGQAAISTDPMVLFGATPIVGAPPAAAQTPADDVPELRAAFMPPAVRPRALPLATARVQARDPTRQAASQADLAATARWNGDPRELWDAFCDGAGVAIDPPQGINPELMRIIGGLLRAAAAGTLQLMAVRATAKHELRAQVTMIQARNNNPLKFSPDTRSALEQLLQPPLRGFLAGPAAMTDAMHDLVGHTIGTMAGTRAALEGVLDRFTPEQLEAKLVGKSMLDSLLPMNRKAKLWELYLQHFDAIRNEAHDDFHSLFGRAFLAAYEQQLDRLQRGEPGET